jgi:Pyruvate/2-oxoacid:ferredoxin oxidoreductase gamma subunit
MGKKSKVLPKRIAGVKVPKALRRSRLIDSLLRNPAGRKIVADALIAGATAAATVLVEHREAVADAGAAGRRRGRRVLSLASAAIEQAAEAMADVVASAARTMLPEEGKRSRPFGRETKH